MTKQTKRFRTEALDRLLLRKKIAEQSGVELGDYGFGFCGDSWPVEVVLPSELASKLSGDNAAGVAKVLADLDSALREVLK